MKPMMIDKEKLRELANENMMKDSVIENTVAQALLVIADSLVPYEDKKEIPSILYGNGCGGTKDTRCMKCNGEGGKEGEVLLHGFPYNFKRTCNHCNGTGKEPRIHHCISKNCSCGNKAQGLQAEKVFIDEGILKEECPPKCSMWNHEEDTRTHAWETKTYTQDEVRKMLEDLKKRDWNTFLEELGEWNRGYHECADEVNAKIDKKIAEL